jgi:hypothetical protein
LDSDFEMSGEVRVAGIGTVRLYNGGQAYFLVYSPEKDETRREFK